MPISASKQPSCTSRRSGTGSTRKWRGSASRHPGGFVLRGLHFPPIVRYAAFERERAVIILDLRVFPGHPLGGVP
jgi:hypothetical protein